MNNIQQLIVDLRKKLITLDCNVFILYVIGSLDKKYISDFKRTQIFREEDFDLLIQLIKDSQLLITPNVITEASNLLESYSFQNNKVGLEALKLITKIIPESYEKSQLLVNRDSFLKFGLSDSAIDNLCQVGAIAITVDFPLYGYLMSRGLKVINFNQVRSESILQ